MKEEGQVLARSTFEMSALLGLNTKDNGNFDTSDD